MVRTMKNSILVVGRELLSREWVSQVDLCQFTGFPAWKISRLFKRLEIFGFVEVKRESRFVRGRPRKLYRLTSSGVEYFADLVGGESQRYR